MRKTMMRETNRYLKGKEDITYQHASILQMLKKMKIPPNGVLLVHSAFKGFSRDGYSPSAVLQSLMEYMQSGTLLMPTMSWRFVRPDTPFFDELTTPSNTGILTELFREQYAQHRSLHPTHSVAGWGRGRGVTEILGSHHQCITPCGEMSPFAQLIHYDAYIIMLGVGIDCCTLVHHAEEMIAPDYYVNPVSKTEEYQCRDRSGKLSTVKLRRHLFLARNYWQFQDQLASDGDLKIFRCDNSICLGFPARKLYRIVVNVLKNKPDAIIAKPGQRYRMM